MPSLVPLIVVCTILMILFITFLILSTCLGPSITSYFTSSSSSSRSRTYTRLSRTRQAAHGVDDDDDEDNHGRQDWFKTTTSRGFRSANGLDMGFGGQEGFELSKLN
ncbi:hypothetical protein ACM66B_006160 [Microbotryomycetes sp. NB124-2]